MKLGLLGLLSALAASVVACEPEIGDPPATPTPPVVVNQYVQYVTYVYAASPPPPPVAPTVGGGAAVAVVPTAAASTGLDVCDDLFATTSRCVAALTDDPAARARFATALEPARERVAAARAGGDPARIAEVSNACAASLDAYRTAPCTP